MKVLKIERFISLFFVVALLTACSSADGRQTRTGAPLVTDQPELASSTPRMSATEAASTSPATPSPGNENVSNGQLVFVGFVDQRPKLIRLDLQSGEETILFDPTESAWLSEVAVSPDGSQLLLAYSPPPEGGQIQYGFTGLYTMPADGSAEPQSLVQRADPSESYFNISWPLDEYLYYAHFTPTVDDEGFIFYGSQIERLHLPSDQVEVLAKNAAWPRLSQDGLLLAYVTEDNDFLLADPDGSNPQPILDQQTFSAVDAPLFSPDGIHICFSAVTPSTAARPSLVDRLLGVGVAQAHSVPSDWYCQPVDGSGEPQRLTELNAIGLYGDFDQTGVQMAFLTAAGVYLMNADGSDLTQLREIATTGTINWLP
jgi:Tol biopolymer transport system component